MMSDGLQRNDLANEWVEVSVVFFRKQLTLVGR